MKKQNWPTLSMFRFKVSEYETKKKKKNRDGIKVFRHVDSANIFSIIRAHLYTIKDVPENASN